jgi:hypothetical protein
VQDLNLTLQLLQTLRHQQILNGSVPTEVLQLTLIDAWTVIYLSLRRTHAEISGKQLGHGIINLQLVTTTEFTVNQSSTILHHQTLGHTISKILRQNKQFTKMLPVQSLNMHNPATTSMPNLNTQLQAQQSCPIHHLNTPKIQGQTTLTHNPKTHLATDSAGTHPNQKPRPHSARREGARQVSSLAIITEIAVMYGRPPGS